MNVRLFVPIVLLVFLCQMIVGTPSQAQENLSVDKIPVVIDTDMSVDDWLAILYLLQHPAIEVQAISVTGVGAAHCEPGIQHALNLLMLAGNPEVPVACGRETPLQGEHSFPQWLRDNVDALAGLTLPLNSNSAFDGTAVDLLTHTIAETTQSITIIALGPVTNVAETLDSDPSLIEKIEMVYIMGGAVDVAGNVGFMVAGNNAAESNIYLDPHAAAIVFASGVPVTLVPLDATNYVRITMDFYKQIESDRTTPEADFVYQALTTQLDFIRSGGYYFWDPLAAAIATDNSLATFEERTLTVVEKEGSQSGRTQEIDTGNPVRVAMTADSERFIQLYLDTLNDRYVQAQS